MKKSRNGFTLMELVVVICVLIILLAAAWWVVNPFEQAKRKRDIDRLADLTNLQQAINIAVQESTTSGAAVLCKPTGAYPCSGSSSSSTSVTSVSDGNGWVKVDLSSQKSVSIPTLPVDPINNEAFHYTYCADKDAYEINATLESDQFKVKMIGDGGNENSKDNTGRYEVGTNLTLIASGGGSCTY
ncbi:type II secretion system protein [Candidatus Daviesbacteria bacterium]|nr:type II secretion system protein [Candidatus Daviesbacteria bacterium]